MTPPEPLSDQDILLLKEAARLAPMSTNPYRPAGSAIVEPRLLERALAELEERRAADPRPIAITITPRRPLAANDACAVSTRDDGLHSWAFDGDDPYIVCHFCGEVRDAHNGRTITKGRLA